MSTYRFAIRVFEHGKRYNAEVTARSVLIDEHKNLVFFGPNGSQVAAFAAGSWVYYKRFEQVED